VKQPRWSPDGRLFYICEQSGWANITHLDVDAADAVPASLPTLELEFGRPGGLLGSSDYVFASNGAVVCSWWDSGVGQLGTLDSATGELSQIMTTAVAFDALASASDSIVAVTQERLEAAAVTRITLEGDGLATTVPLKRSTDQQLDMAYLSVAEDLTWQNSQNLTVHGFFYPPTNA